MILFTSGTTGRSKGALLTHNANIRGAVNTCDLMGYAAGETFFNAFPLFHINARYTTVVPALVLDDARAVLHDRFTASGFWDIVRAEGITAFNFMGALVMMLFKQPERPDDADNPARVAYGAPAPVAVLEPFEERFGVKLIEVFGSTELCACVQNTVEERKIGSCGRAAPDCIVEIHDEHGRRVAAGRRGRVRRPPAASRTSSSRSTGATRPRPRRHSAGPGSTRATGASRTRTAGSRSSTASRTRSGGAARTSRRGRSSRC